MNTYPYSVGDFTSNDVGYLNDTLNHLIASMGGGSATAANQVIQIGLETDFLDQSVFADTNNVSVFKNDNDSEYGNSVFKNGYNATVFPGNSVFTTGDDASYGESVFIDTKGVSWLEDIYYGQIDESNESVFVSANTGQSYLNELVSLPQLGNLAYRLFSDISLTNIVGAISSFAAYNPSYIQISLTPIQLASDLTYNIIATYSILSI